MGNILQFLRIYWFQLLQIIASLYIGGNLAQQISMQRQKSVAARMARFTLAIFFSLAYYALFFYLTSVFTRS